MVALIIPGIVLAPIFHILHLPSINTQRMKIESLILTTDLLNLEREVQVHMKLIKYIKKLN
jgi:hypothetical protein